MLLTDKEDYENAEVFYLKSLSIREKVLGVKTEHTIPTYLLKNENMLNNNY